MISFADGKPSPDLVRLQRTQKALASQFFQYCDSRGLTVFLVAGSALGAVRHEDMIPWDDDIDVGMMRGDFDRLLEGFEEDPIEGLFLQSWRTERGYPLAYAKLRIEGTHFGEPAFDGLGFHQGIFIDIFPFDQVPRSNLIATIQRLTIAFLGLILLSFNEANVGRSQSSMKRIIRKMVLRVRPILPLQLMIKLRERVSKWGNDEARSDQTDVISFQMLGTARAEKTRVKESLLVPPVQQRFGKDLAPIPAKSDAYLTSFFGDWRKLPSPDQRKPAHASRVDFGRMTE